MQPFVWGAPALCTRGRRGGFAFGRSMVKLSIYI